MTEELRANCLSSDSIAALLDPRIPSCGQRCKYNGECRRGWTFQDVLGLRESFWGKDSLTSREERRKRIFNLLSIVNCDGGQFRCNSKLVCERFFKLLHGIPDGRAYQHVKAKLLMNLDDEDSIVQTKPVLRGAIIENNIQSWLSSYAEKCGDKMPVPGTVSHTVLGFTYRLPLYEMKEVWKLYTTEHTELGLVECVCTYQYFCRVWNSRLPNVVLAEKTSGFKQCKVSCN